MSKTNKELVAELTAAYISSWNNCSSGTHLNPGNVKNVFNTFKELIESMDNKETK